MKIEVDLIKSRTEDELRALRCAAVAILSTLPRDEAELAIEEWQAVSRVRDADEAEQPPRRRYMVPGVPMSYEETDVEIAVRQSDPEGDYGEISPDEKPSESATLEPTGEISPEPEQQTAAPDEFEFAGRRFSTKKRGPRAALDHAVKLLAECTLDDLEVLWVPLGGLTEIFERGGRDDLINLLNKAVTERHRTLTEHASDSGEVASDADAPEPEAGPGPGEEGSDTPDDGSDIPFETEPTLDRSEMGSGEVSDRLGPPTPRGGNGSAGETDGLQFGRREVPRPSQEPEVEDDVAEEWRRDHPPSKKVEPEPLRDLLRRAMDVLGRGRVADIIEHHGATKVAELDEAGAAAVRAQVTSEMDAAP